MLFNIWLAGAFATAFAFILTNGRFLRLEEMIDELEADHPEYSERRVLLVVGIFLVLLMILWPYTITQIARSAIHEGTK